MSLVIEWIGILNFNRPIVKKKLYLVIMLVLLL